MKQVKIKLPLRALTLAGGCGAVCRPRDAHFSQGAARREEVRVYHHPYCRAV